KDRHVVQPQCFDRFLPAAGVFVAAVEEQQSILRGLRRQPGPIEQFGAVADSKSMLGGLARCGDGNVCSFIHDASSWAEAAASGRAAAAPRASTASRRSRAT